MGLKLGSGLHFADRCCRCIEKTFIEDQHFQRTALHVLQTQPFLSKIFEDCKLKLFFSTFFFSERFVLGIKFCTFVAFTFLL